MFLDHEVHLLQIDNKPVLPVPHHEATQDSLRKIIHEQHKQSSPRMDPCGTPYLGVCQDEVACSIHTFGVFHYCMFGTTLLPLILLFPQHQTRLHFLQQKHVVNCVKYLTKVKK